MLDAGTGDVVLWAPALHTADSGASPHTTALGEGITWCAATQALWWLDIEGQALFRWNAAGGVRRWSLPERPGAVVARERGGLVLALASGIGLFDPEAGAWTAQVAFEHPVPRYRANEGKCDRQGRFWCGTMDAEEESSTSGLFRCDTDFRLERMLDRVAVPNSLVWSPEGTRVYFADSPTKTIRVFDYDLHAGSLMNERVFARVEGPGVPDGSTVDAEGCLWNCEWGGSRLVRYTPDGKIDRIVPMPVRRPTCCVFGAADLRTLFVTSARIGLDPEELGQEPNAGGVWALDVGVAGVAETPFRG